MSSQRLSTAHDDVITQEVNNKGILILNRPKLLNTLHTAMVDKLSQTLKEWEKDKMLVILKGTGDKAFCAGGDLPELTKDLGNVAPNTLKLHSLLILVNTLSIPFVSLLNGIVFGGGAGLAVAGRYRIATERALFGMPESRLGFFPNAGGSFFLPRLRGKLGWYLGLTGHRLAGADLKHTGLATHCCDSKNLMALEKALLEGPSVEGVEDVLNRFDEKDLPEFSLTPVMDEIDHCFSAGSVEEIISNVQDYRAKSIWAQSTFDTLTNMSPTSLKVIFKMLQKGKDKSLEECLEMETILIANFLSRKEVFEGMRAQFIDKDFLPIWDPLTLEEVTEELVEKHFTAVPICSKI